MPERQGKRPGSIRTGPAPVSGLGRALDARKEGVDMDRLKLTIMEVKEPQKIGDKGAEKLCFQGKDPEGKVFLYCTFTKALFEAIRGNQGKTIEADVEVVERDVNGNHYVDRKVSQLYVSGQPVSKPGRTFGGHSESPEARASIEAQCAYKGVIDLICGKIITGEHPLARAAIKWASARLVVNEGEK
jgi:hypothetical protein